MDCLQNKSLRAREVFLLFSKPSNRTCLPCNALKEAFKVEFVIRAMQSLESLGLPLISDQSLKSKLISDAKFDFESYKAMLSLEELSLRPSDRRTKYSTSFPMLTLSTKNYHVVKAIVGHLSTKMIIFRGVE